ncbi:MAG TPA: hypothetical protein VLI65_12120, partial [Pyrinomonadaceae bacterium]|nr:hypothetical protein [Pyrinomonadaceae bacterium]
GTRAACQALERSRLEPTDIDIIICATTTPDQIMPSTGALIQAQIGASNAAGMDVFAACSGFLYGLTMVESMIKTGQVRNALVIGAEVLTKYVDYTDRSTCVIFGDGAGAAVVGPVPEGKGILATKIRSDGRYEDQLYCPGGGTKMGTTHQTIDDRMHFFKMKGNELFKVAVRSMADISAEMLAKAGYTVDGRPCHPASGKSAHHGRCCLAVGRSGRKGFFEYCRTRQYVVCVNTDRDRRVYRNWKDQRRKFSTSNSVWRRRDVGRNAYSILSVRRAVRPSKQVGSL